MNNDCVDSELTDSEIPVTSTLILPQQQSAVFLKHFGVAGPLVVETNVYAWMERLSPDYHGGSWTFHELSNGGFWMHPNTEQLRVRWADNYFDATVSGETAGLIACLFTFCHLSYSRPKQEAERFAEYFLNLRDFAYSHKDADLIFRAID